jgi:hypothetical protein
MEAGLEPAGEARAQLGPVVKIDDGRIREHLDEVVRSTVEETLITLLAAAASLLGRSACVLSWHPAQFMVGQT